jgi:hypothetical protein
MVTSRNENDFGASFPETNHDSLQICLVVIFGLFEAVEMSHFNQLLAICFNDEYPTGV